MVRTAQKLVKREEVLVAILIVLAVFASLIPNIYSFLNRHLIPSRREWVYVHNYLYDFNSYLSKMKQGEQGRWTVVEKYTSEPHQGSLYQILYLLLGKMGGVFGFSVSLTHFFTRIFLGTAWLVVIYLFLSLFFKEKFWRLACFLVILLSSSYPRQLPGRLTTWYDWWSEFNVFARPTFLPHFLVGHIAIALCLLFFILSLREKRSQKALIYTLSAGLLALIGGLVLPPSLLAIYGSLAIFILGVFWVGKAADFAKTLKIGFLIFLLSIPSVFYFLALFSQYPWKEIADWEKAHPIWVDMKMYAFSQGTTFFLALLAIGAVKKDVLFFLPVGWFLTHLLGTWFLNRTRLYLPLRFWQVASFVPAGILTIWLVEIVSEFFQKYLRLRLRCHPEFISGSLRFILPSFIFLSFLPGIFLNFKYLISRERALLTYDFDPVPYPTQEHYPLKTLMQAFDWLSQNTKPEEVVLAHLTTGNFIPAYADNTVYIGNITQTVKIGEKYDKSTDFFSGKFSLTEAKAFLKENNISYVFWGPQERDWGGDLSQYPFLEKVYENQDVVIFAFTP